MRSKPVIQGVRTASGVVPIWTRPRPNGPALLVICGAFAATDAFSSLIDSLPEADLTVAHLPGLFWATDAPVSVASFANAFRELVDQRLSKPLTILGGSTGGLVAMRLSDLGEIVALDPPISTTGLWPLEDWARMAPLTDQHRRWYESILLDQDYKPLVDGLTKRITCLVGDLPLLPRRPLKAMPSLIHEDDLAQLRANPLVELHIVENSGHDILQDNLQSVIVAVRNSFAKTTYSGMEPG